MGVQLHSQCIELSLRKLCFESRGDKLALTILLIVVECITNTNHATIDQQIRTERSWNARKETWQKELGARAHIIERPDDQSDRCGRGAVNDRYQQKRRQVNEKTRLPRAADERVTAREPDHYRRQRRPPQPYQDAPREDAER